MFKITSLPYRFYDNRLVSAAVKKNNAPAEVKRENPCSYNNKIHLMHYNPNGDDFIKVFNYWGQYYDVHYNSKTKESFIRFFEYGGKNKKHNVYYDNAKKHFYIMIGKPVEIRIYNLSLKEREQKSYQLDGNEYPILYDKKDKRPYKVSLRFITLEPYPILKEEKLRIKTHILSEKEKQQIKNKTDADIQLEKKQKKLTN